MQAALIGNRHTGFTSVLQLIGNTSSSFFSWDSAKGIPFGAYFDFEQDIFFKQYSMKCRADSGSQGSCTKQGPRSWELLYSLDGVTYTPFEERLDVSWEPGEEKTFSTEVVKLRYLKLLIYSNNGWSGVCTSLVSLNFITSETNLVASADDSKVTLSWDVVENAISYNIKRSTIEGGPYTVIADNVSENSYVDLDVENGTTYYYVVTANTADGESDNSNEASATPISPELHIVLEVGEQIQLIGNILPEKLGDPNLEWNSTLPNIASVDATGKVTANAEGVTRIQVKTIDGTWTDYALVEVLASGGGDPDQYRLSILLEVGESCLLKFAESGQDIIWQSGTPTVATVNPSNTQITKVTAHSPGLTLITVQTADGSKSDQIYVTVIE